MQKLHPRDLLVESVALEETPWVSQGQAANQFGVLHGQEQRNRPT
jgi:hypothetical protein